MQVDAAEQRIIIQHLLKVRHEPLSIYRIAMESAAQLVIDASICHVLQRHPDHLQLRYSCRCADLTPRAMLVHSQEEFERHSVGKLGSSAKTAVHGVEFSSKLVAGLSQHLKRHAAARSNAALAAQGSAAALFEVIGELCSLLLYLLAVILVIIGYGRQNAREPWHYLRPVPAVIWWEVGASIQRTPIRRHENRHGPATLPCQRLYRLHIDAVYIGTLFAVYLN